MAELASVRAYLRGDLAVSGANQNDNTRVTAIVNNGLDTWASFAELEDDDVLQLVKYIRNPGGAEEGCPIPATSIGRIQIACYAARYYEMVGRPLTAVTMRWTRIKQFKALINIQKDYSEPDTIEPPTKNSKIVEWTEQLEEYLTKVRGVRKIPLSYLIRENVDPGDIQAFAADYDKPYSAMYKSFQEEMIARATHTDPTYATDNETLYNIISTALADTPFVTSIKKHRSAKDGRKAYQDLVIHHSGSSKWTELAAESDKKATTAVWNGRSARYTLATHINNLRSYHNDLLRANDHVKYGIPSETQRVDRLLTSIQTNEPTILAGITTVKSSTDANTGLYTDFERAADFILRVAPKSKTKDHNVSGVQQDFDNVDKAVSKGPKTGVELRYHTRKEFRELSKEEKDELLEIRGPPGNPPSGKGGGKRRGDQSKGNNALKKMKKANKKKDRTIASLKSELKGLKEGKGDSDTGKKKPLEKPTQRE